MTPPEVYEKRTSTVEAEAEMLSRLRIQEADAEERRIANRFRRHAAFGALCFGLAAAVGGFFVAADMRPIFTSAFFSIISGVIGWAVGKGKPEKD